VAKSVIVALAMMSWPKFESLSPDGEGVADALAS
jgi:hypothetical protein